MLIENYETKKIFNECVKNDNDLMKLFDIFADAGYKYCGNYLYQTKDRKHNSDYIMDLQFESEYDDILYTIMFDEFEKNNIMITESYLTA